MMLNRWTVRLASVASRQFQPVMTPPVLMPATWQLLASPRVPKRTYASPSAKNLKRTALYPVHVDAGAKMVPFGGYDMPLEYAGQAHVQSHSWTREKASLFD